MKKLLLAGLAILVPGFLTAADKTKSLRALLVTGGCCHDYEMQKVIVSEGISARANVEWNIVHEGGDSREHRVSIYQGAEWAKGYDVIVHNECFGQVADVALVERIAAAHKAGVPAVMLHCSSHSYRAAETDEWRKVIGITSSSHEKRRDLLVKTIAARHPVMRGFPETWFNANDELYKNEKIWPHVVPLANAFGQDTQKEHIVIWVSTYGKGRTFSTTLGHTNETMANPVYLDLITRGLLWTCGKLTDDGKPAKGYGPSAR